MMLSIVLLLISAVLLLIYFWKEWQKNRNLPPGPIGLPILGYLPFFNPNLYEATADFHRKYGSISSVRLGSKLVVFLNDDSAIREAFIKNGDALSGRPKDLLLFSHTNKNRGIINSNGAEWTMLRRFTASSLRDFGMGKLSLEGKIHEECEMILKEFQSSQGEPFHVHHLLMQFSSNIICSLIFGDRYEYDDERLQRLMAIIQDLFTNFDQGGILNWLPYLRVFPYFRRLMNEQLARVARLWDFVYERAEEHKAMRKGNENEPPKDFLDAYLAEMHGESGDDDRAKVFENHFVFNITQLFTAGTETTSTTLEWGLVLLLKHVDVQTKIQEEIDRVVGKGRLPSWTDRAKMPYTEAAILEIHRVGRMGPTSLPRATTEDVRIMGYTIPSQTIVFGSFAELAMNEKYYPDPFQFNPEHFLTPEGKVNTKLPTYPFSLGKRACVGDSLAKMELFLFLSSILQKFLLRSPPGVIPEIPEKRPKGLTVKPPPYWICATPR